MQTDGWNSKGVHEDNIQFGVWLSPKRSFYRTAVQDEAAVGLTLLEAVGLRGAEAEVVEERELQL